MNRRLRDAERGPAGSPRVQQRPGTAPVTTVIDTDTGVDDAVALALAANSPELDVSALTTVAGNAEVGECTRNVLLLAGELWRDTPPRVAEGADRPLDKRLTTAPEVHGIDGLGGVRATLPTPALAPLDKAAYTVLSETLRGHATPTAAPGRSLLVATGPLTNLALALRFDPHALDGFERIVIMGGALDVPGNTGPVAEFNFYVDPEAADIVLRSGLDITVVPLDATTMVHLTRERLEALPRWNDSLRRAAGPASEWGSGMTLVGATLARALDYYIRYQAEESGLDAGYMHDPVAVAAAFAPGLVGTREIALSVVADGPERGRSIPTDDARPPVRVALNADRAGVLDLIYARVLLPLFG